MAAARIVNLPSPVSGVEYELEILRNKIKLLEQRLDQVLSFHTSGLDQMIDVFTHGQCRRIPIRSIVMIKSINNYSTIYLDGGEAILTSRTLKHWESLCSGHGMVRVHRSYLVHINKVRTVLTNQGYMMLQDGLKAEYSRRSRSDLHRLISNGQ